MSAKIKQIKQTLPIQLEPEVNRDIQGINLYLCSFTWNRRPFVNIQTGQKQKIKLWCFGGLVLLNNSLKAGRHILVHEKVPKYITNQKGEVIETRYVNKTKIVGKNYGFEALASILSVIEECSLRFLTRFPKKPSIVMRFLGKLHKKKRKKSNLKNKKQIRHRRKELYDIKKDWITNNEENISDIDAVIAEFNWILGEEKKKDSYSELLTAKRQIKELEKRNRKLQVALNIMGGD